MQKHYDYIIAGGGCAGLSLLMRLMQDPFFNSKEILVIDRSPKNTNDRTWCFWEKETGLFEPVVTHRWDTIAFYAEEFSFIKPIVPYQYKMIRAIDLYTFVKDKVKDHKNIHWLSGTVSSITNTKGAVTVQVDEVDITADWAFNSLFVSAEVKVPKRKRAYNLLQHFTGWMIETDEPCFDPSVATYMDFRISQDKGTAFMYVLPVSATHALVEYTLFTDTLLAAGEYENALIKYITDFLSVKNYKVVHTENGVIPMTNQRFPLQDGRIVYMGMAGGQVKGSSGYAFQFIQKRTATIVEELKKEKSVFDRRSFSDRKFQWYDAVLLHVLHHKKMSGADIFKGFFQNNDPGKLFKFLDNETGLFEDLQIMRSVPTGIFLPVALKELFN